MDRGLVVLLLSILIALVISAWVMAKTDDDEPGGGW